MLYYIILQMRKKTFQPAYNTTQRQMLISIPDKRSGMHILKINWEVEGVSYYFEETVFLP